MKLRRFFTGLLAALVALPVFMRSAAADLQSEFAELSEKYAGRISESALQKAEEKVSAAVEAEANRKTYSPEEIAKLEDEAKAAKEKEQSTANKMLGGLTMAATGIGGMQLMQGMAEKKADEEAAEDLSAYLATVKCGVGENKSVGYNGVGKTPEDPKTLIDARLNYATTAGKMKAAKSALGLAPGIEEELAIDITGLYDNSGTDVGGITKRLGGELDISCDANGKCEAGTKGRNRMIAGGIAAGVGVVGGLVGDSMINGKLGEMMKEGKEKREASKKEKEEEKKRDKERAEELRELAHSEKVAAAAANISQAEKQAALARADRYDSEAADLESRAAKSDDGGADLDLGGLAGTASSLVSGGGGGDAGALSGLTGMVPGLGGG